MNKTLLIVVVLIALVGLSAVGFYNSMVGMDEGLKSLDAQVENMYERRADLIPQIAAVVKNYTEYEAGTLTDVVALREWATNLATLENMAAAGDIKSPEFNGLLASTLSTVRLTVEQYPVLKADTQFTALLTELEGSENRIRTAIRDYNDTISPYNLKVRSFPRGKLFSGMFGFTEKERITPPDEKAIKDVPDVDALLN
jgi:LemA protein